MKYVIIHCEKLTDTIEKGQKPRSLGNNQCLVEVTKENENILFEYRKYTAGEIRGMDLETGVPHQEKHVDQQMLSPFADKSYKDGSKLYENIIGASLEIAANSTDSIVLNVPFERCFLSEVEILNGKNGDTANFYLAVALGNDEYMPVYQHGYDVNISENIYRRKSSYEAELSSTLWLMVEYTNNSSELSKIGINAILHEAIK